MTQTFCATAAGQLPVTFGRIPRIFSQRCSEESIWDCALLLKVGVPFSSTVSFLKHSINARITDPHTFFLSSTASTNNAVSRTLTAVPLPPSCYPRPPGTTSRPS
jgi:hypothetical protein